MSRTIQMLINPALYVFSLHSVDDALTTSKLSDISNGLEYLHSNDVVHGNLRGVRGRSPH